MTKHVCAVTRGRGRIRALGTQLPRPAAVRVPGGGRQAGRHAGLRAGGRRWPCCFVFGLGPHTSSANGYEQRESGAGSDKAVAWERLASKCESAVVAEQRAGFFVVSERRGVGILSLLRRPAEGGGLGLCSGGAAGHGLLGATVKGRAAAPGEAPQAWPPGGGQLRACLKAENTGLNGGPVLARAARVARGCTSCRPHHWLLAGAGGRRAGRGGGALRGLPAAARHARE